VLQGLALLAEASFATKLDVSTKVIENTRPTQISAIAARWHGNCSSATSAETLGSRVVGAEPAAKAGHSTRAHTLWRPRKLMREKAGPGYMGF